MGQTSRLDLVVFGATGFTGQHAAAQLAGIAGQRGLRWGVAGRSDQKLQALLKDIADKTGKDVSSTKVIVADVNNEQSLKDMCSQATVLVNCCGPYTLHGEAVVRAAIHCGAHYLDVSGEPNFIELMQLKYDGAARAAGVCVVSACGFESVPADLGVLFLQQHFGGVLNSVECYMSPDAQYGGVNFGTWHSLVYSLAHFSSIPGIRKKLYPTRLPNFVPKLKSRFPLHKRFNGWCMPFPGNDSSTVYRTQRHLHHTEQRRPAQIKTYVRFHSLLNAIAVALMSAFIYILSQFKATRQILLDYSRSFSLGMITRGPAEEVIRTAKYEFLFYGNGWDKAVDTNIDILPPRKYVMAKVWGTNPGYGMTVVGLLYSAVVILEERSALPAGGGVMTPGIAFGKTSLLKHLQENGVHFEITSSKTHTD